MVIAKGMHLAAGLLGERGGLTFRRALMDAQDGVRKGRGSNTELESDGVGLLLGRRANVVRVLVAGVGHVWIAREVPLSSLNAIHAGSQ